MTTLKEATLFFLALTALAPASCRRFDYRGVRCDVAAPNDCPPGFACRSDDGGASGYCARPAIAEDAGADAGVDAGIALGDDAGDGGQDGGAIDAGPVDNPQARVTAIMPRLPVVGDFVSVSGTATNSEGFSVSEVEVQIDDAGWSATNWDGNGWSVTFIATRFAHVIRARAIGSGGAVGPASAPYSILTVGAPATDVVGQPEVQFSAKCEGTPGRSGLKNPEPVAIDLPRRRLYVGDTDNHRILVFQLTGAGYPDSADAIAVIGQPDFSKCDEPLVPSNAVVGSPSGLAVDPVSGRLFVADSAFNRVLIFEANILDAGLRAVRVLGQSNMTSGVFDAGEAGMREPMGLAYNGAGKLFVADSANNRVLAFSISSSDTDDGPPATAVFGQVDFAAGAPGLSASRLSGPKGLAYSPEKQLLFVADTTNHRVIVFDTANMDAGAADAAVAVLGQSDFESADAGAGTMNSPQGLALEPDGGRRLYVADTKNHRVLVFDTETVDSGEAPIAVLGQQTFDASASGTSATTLNSPIDVTVFVEGGARRLFVSDKRNSRIVAFDVSNITNGMTASSLLGHSTEGVTDFGSRCENGPGDIGLVQPEGVAIDFKNNRLFVSDQSIDPLNPRNRVLVFALDSLDRPSGNRRAFAVIGQSSFNDCAGPSPTQNRFNGPGALAFDDARNRLFVADPIVHRVLEFDTQTIQNGMNARRVLGQTDFTSSVTPQPSQTAIMTPAGLAIDADGGRLFVSDGRLHRVLVFNGLGNDGGIENNADAGFVLGQPDFTSNTAATTPYRFNKPGGLAFDPAQNRLFVADTGNRRILIFNAAALANGMAASVVLGQPNYTSSGDTTGDGGWSLAFAPSASRLFVTDDQAHRVAVFNVATAADGQMAATVIGQTNLSDVDAGLSQSRFNQPRGIAISPANSALYVVDSLNYRILMFDVGP